ncbi:hypothetical protein IIB50_00850, partial [Patescibacteria group bacterium]|nr:hypothetical protein [Patescibacteria group bacterium]
GWGPENKGSDCLEHPLELYGAVDLICYANFLERSEEFKIVVFVKDDVEARKIFAKRILEDVHITIDFDYNADYKTFWLLDSSYPFIHPEGRSSRNVFLH